MRKLVAGFVAVLSSLALASPATAAVPPKVTGLTLVNQAAGAIDVAWSAASTATSYEVYRGGTLRASVTPTNWQDTGRVVGSTYSYQVAARNADGLGVKSDAVSIVYQTPTTTPPPPPSTGNVLFTGDFETGNFSQWTGVQSFSPSYYSAVTTPVRQGTYAGRFQVVQGNCFGGDCVGTRARTEAFTSPQLVDATEGSERWFRWYSYFPAQAVFQKHLFMQLFAADNQPSQYSAAGHFGIMDIAPTADGVGTIKFQRNGDRYTMPARRNQWIKFELRVVYSADPTKGLYELWVDGIKVMSYADASKPPNTGVYFKQGAYQNSNAPSATVYHDGLRIATTRAAADAG